MTFNPKISTIIHFVDNASNIDDDVKNKLLILLKQQQLKNKTIYNKKRRRVQPINKFKKKRKLNNGRSNPIVIDDDDDDDVDTIFGGLDDLINEDVFTPTINQPIINNNNHIVNVNFNAPIHNTNTINNNNSIIKEKTASDNGGYFGDVLLQFTLKTKNKGVRFFIMRHLEVNTHIISKNMFDFLMGECSAIIHDAQNSFIFRYYNEILRIGRGYDAIVAGQHNKYTLSFIDGLARELVKRFIADPAHERMIKLSKMFTWSPDVAMMRSTTQYNSDLNIGLFARKKGLRLKKKDEYDLGYYTGVKTSTNEDSKSQYKITLESNSKVMIDGFKNGEITCMACLYNHKCNNNQIEFQEDDDENVEVCLIRDVKRHEEIFTNYGDNYFKSLECVCGDMNCISN